MIFFVQTEEETAVKQTLIQWKFFEINNFISFYTSWDWSATN